MRIDLEGNEAERVEPAGWTIGMSFVVLISVAGSCAHAPGQYRCPAHRLADGSKQAWRAAFAPQLEGVATAHDDELRFQRVSLRTNQIDRHAERRERFADLGAEFRHGNETAANEMNTARRNVPANFRIAGR